jgi:hypothetical protein
VLKARDRGTDQPGVRRASIRSVVAAVAALLCTGLVATGPTPTAAATCTANLSAAQLNSVFAAPGVGRTAATAGYGGGDYQHVYELGGGRRLWLFQDMFFSNDNDLRDSLKDAAHNAGLLQRGNCWGTVGAPRMRNFIGTAQTTPLFHWFWPMDGELGADGTLWIFMVEMSNPAGTGATWGARPIGTWVARVNPTTLKVVSFAKAKDSGTRLFGWSVVSDASWSYLYGHCYRQYIHQVNGVGQFDAACMPSTYLARVPKGQFGAAPQYWTGSTWSTRKELARPVLTRGHANPMDVQRFGKVYVNVTKIDDWWGASVFVDRAPAPQGPWTRARTISVVNNRKCSQCGVYHAVLFPTLGPDGKMILSWSNGGPFTLWQRNAALYRPTFLAVPVPS